MTSKELEKLENEESIESNMLKRAYIEIIVAFILTGLVLFILGLVIYLRYFS